MILAFEGFSSGPTLSYFFSIKIHFSDVCGFASKLDV